VWFPIPSFAAAAAAIGLAIFLLAKPYPLVFHRILAAALCASSLIQLGNGLAIADDTHALIWRRMAWFGELALPATLLYIGSVLTQVRSANIEVEVWWRAHAVAITAAGLAVYSLFYDVFSIVAGNGQIGMFVLGSPGRVAYVFVLLALVLGLAQFEQILRVARDPLRYQLKFVLIGLGGIGGYGIYETSQLLLLSEWRAEYGIGNGLATLVALGLVVYGLGRTRLQEVQSKVHLSVQVLVGSVTFLVVGLYLVAVGVIGEAIRYSGLPASTLLSTVSVFVSLIGLAVVLYSRTVRAGLRRWIARHVYRSKYDYRAKWLEVTDAFRDVASVDDILGRLLNLLSRTFGAARLSIWMRSDTDGQFYQVQTVNIEPPPDPFPVSHPVIVRLKTIREPVSIDEQASSGRLANDRTLPATRAILYVPICSGEELIAFVALSREPGGETYGVDDWDLLRAMTHHVGVLLSHARLAEEKRTAAELEALHRFSAFCLHDLKNLTARLSLVVQNAKVHGRDPAFQESAMRTVGGTVEKMMELMMKLSLKSVPAGLPEILDVHELIVDIIGSLNGGLRVQVNNLDERLPSVKAVREQLDQVLLNVLLNAQQAIGEQGEIWIRTEKADKSVRITVGDTGCGIPPPMLRTLFQPLRTMKAGGLGIGLYQCKQIIEAHHGMIRVESVVGHGTTVQIELPVTPNED
jgi:putative PEP-CTERM system histidine kinase